MDSSDIWLAELKALSINEEGAKVPVSVRPSDAMSQRTTSPSRLRFAGAIIHAGIASNASTKYVFSVG